MQITTATGRTVEIYMNNEAGITYRNVKDGKATGAVRSADRATAKKGSVGREIMDAIDAQAAAQDEVADQVATEVAEIAETPVKAEAAAHAVWTEPTEDEIREARAGMSAKALARKSWVARNRRAELIRGAINLKW